MNSATYLAFFDEMEKIKEAGLLRDIGMRIVRTAKAAPGAAVQGMKSIPGHVRGSIQNAGSTISAFGTPIDSFKKGWKATTTDFHQMGRGQKALLAMGFAGSAHEALAKNDPLGQGRGRIERAATAVGDQLGGIVGTPFGITGGIVGGQIGRKAGKAVGKGIQLLVPKKSQPPATL